LRQIIYGSVYSLDTDPLEEDVDGAEAADEEEEEELEEKNDAPEQVKKVNRVRISRGTPFSRAPDRIISPQDTGTAIKSKRPMSKLNN